MQTAPRMAVPQVIVPIARLDRPALAALAFARSISQDVTAVSLGDATETERLRQDWAARADGIALVSLGPARAASLRSLLGYLDERERRDPERPLTVVVSDIVPRRRWSYLLHGTTLRLKLRLFFRPNTVVVDVPYHL